MNGYTEVARLMVDKGANTTLGDIQPIVVAAKGSLQSRSEWK